MDGYSDNIGSDQYYVKDSPTFPVSNYKVSNTGCGLGFYEDNLRFEQYGIPARLRGINPDPYIQDSIYDNPRFNPIRSCTVPARKNFIVNTSCEPGLACNQWMDEPRFDTPKPNPGSPPPKKKKESFNIGGNSVELDAMTILLMFIFIVLVVLVFYYWKSLGDLKKNVEVIKELVRNIRQ